MLGRGAISQSAAAVAAASSTGLKRLFEQAKEGAVKKEGKLVLFNPTSGFIRSSSDCAKLITQHTCYECMLLI